MEKLIYSAADMPTFQNVVYANQQQAKSCPRGNIELVQNLQTGLIYNRAFDESLMVYDENYQNEQSLSGGFIEHLEEVAAIVGRHLGKDGLIEIGCGKGAFLEVLQEKGFDVHGYDNAYQGNNPAITKSFFNAASPKKGKAIILRHVLEHIKNPLEFLSGLKADNNAGLIYIEVPCFDWICENKAWFDVCYEHVNYFRLPDLQKAFGKIVESGRLFGGQYLYIVADLASYDAARVKFSDAVNFPPDFLKDMPGGSNSGNNAIWGASTKGVIFSILGQRNGFQITEAIDINPAKQGKFLPVTGIKVISPESFMQRQNDGAVIYVMNSNYFSEIKDMTKNQFQYRKIDNG